MVNKSPRKGKGPASTFHSIESRGLEGKGVSSTSRDKVEKEKGKMHEMDGIDKLEWNRGRFEPLDREYSLFGRLDEQALASWRDKTHVPERQEEGSLANNKEAVERDMPSHTQKTREGTSKEGSKIG